MGCSEQPRCCDAQPMDRPKKNPPNRSNVIAIGHEVVRQIDLANIRVLEGDVFEAMAKLEKARKEIAYAILRGAEVEPGPFRAFVDRSEKVTRRGSAVRVRLTVR